MRRIRNRQEDETLRDTVPRDREEARARVITRRMRRVFQ